MSSSRPPAEHRTQAAPTALLAVLALLAGIGSAAAGPTDSAAELRPFQASYLWIWNGAQVALSRLNFTHQQGDLWVYSSSTEPRGLGHLYPIRPRLQSTMRIDAQGVQPLHFSVTGSGQRHDGNVSFNWQGDAGVASGTYDGSPINLPITRGVQDDLSVQIAMILQMLRGTPPQMLREIDKHGIRDYLYQRVGEETLVTKSGKFDTVIYATQHPGSPRVTRYWSAPTEGYIPLQVQQTLNGRIEWTMTLESFKRD